MGGIANGESGVRQGRKMEQGLEIWRMKTHEEILVLSREAIFILPVGRMKMHATSRLIRRHPVISRMVSDVRILAHNPPRPHPGKGRNFLSAKEATQNIDKVVRERPCIRLIVGMHTSGIYACFVSVRRVWPANIESFIERSDLLSLIDRSEFSDRELYRLTEGLVRD